MRKREQTAAEEPRRRAEAQMKTRGAGRSAAAQAHDERGRLLHELHVHQIELEIQNEELRSARNQIEAALQRYTELFDFAPVGYVVVDSLGSILDANLEFARMVGQPRSALKGWSLGAFLELGQRARLVGFLQKRLEAGPGQPSASLEVAVQPKNGGPIAVRLVASVLEGPFKTVLVALHDMTAIKRAESTCEEMARRDDFMAALSHELRNPLSPICTSLSLLDRVDPGSAAARKAIATIERQVRHLARIVDDLLDVTRIAHGKVNLRVERLELWTLVRQAIEDHRHEFQEKNITLGTHFEDVALWVDADGTRLVQVVGNLMMNASKFTPGGGRVDVDLRRDGHEAVLSVRDTGAGIAPEVQERLFTPFIQAPQSLERSRGGLGLGLAMVKGLVELHKGTVAVKSEGLGRGSEFTVRLPLAEAPAVQEAPAAPGPSKSAHRVLVIEDNTDAADALRELFAYEGHDARAAYDGPSGLTLAREFRPEIVFCDIGLPGMDGYAVARAMRAEPAFAETYLVALSGYARPEDRQRSAEAGFDLHLAKPPSEQELDRVLAR